MALRSDFLNLLLGQQQGKSESLGFRLWQQRFKYGIHVM